MTCSFDVRNWVLALWFTLLGVADAAAQAEPVPLPDDPVASEAEPLPPPAAEPPAAPPPAEPDAPAAAEAPSPPQHRAVVVPYIRATPPPRPADEEEEEFASYREIGGHYLPPAVFVPSALTFNYFGVRAGLEYHSVPGFSRDLSFFGEGEYSPATLKTINAAETVDFALRLHEYVAIVGDAYGLARVGANAPTLLGTGADYTYGGDAGVLLKLFRIGGFQMAVRGQVGYFAGQRAGVLGLFQDIGGIVQNAITQLTEIQDISQVDLPARLASIENSIRVATTAMLTPFRGVQYGASLNLAQGLGPVGIQLSFGLYGRSETYDIPVFDVMAARVATQVRSEESLYPRFGGALDINLEKFFMPIDLVGEYLYTQMSLSSELPGEQGDRSWAEHLFALGVHYSELLDLQLGFTAYIVYGQDPIAGENVRTAGKPLDVGAQFVFRFMR